MKDTEKKTIEIIKKAINTPEEWIKGDANFHPLESGKYLVYNHGRLDVLKYSSKYKLWNCSDENRSTGIDKVDAFYGEPFPDSLYAWEYEDILISFMTKRTFGKKKYKKLTGGTNERTN